MTNSSYIGRSITTGKYHWAHSINTTSCNYSGQNRTSRTRMSQRAEIEKASEGSFCSKCFSNKIGLSLKENALRLFDHLAQKEA